MFRLDTTGGDQLFTYCIDEATFTTTGVTYDEGTWTQANVPDIDNVTAILQNSYPVRSVAQIQAATGITVTEHQAIAVTQSAIWNFTDNLHLNRNIASQNAGSPMGRLYDYLLGVAASPVVEPPPALNITPANLNGTAGTRVGPFTINVTPASATVTVTNNAGAAFTDGAGNPIVPNANGQQFWVTPPAAGNIGISATTEVAVPTGRVFLHPTTPQFPAARQKLILASSTEVTTNATASVVAAAAPTTTTTTAAPTTTAAGPTTTVAGASVDTPTTTGAPIVAALPPVPAAAPPVNPATGVVTLPATGSSSQLPSLLIAAGTLALGIAITAMTRRRAPSS
jgi:TQXA domain-containing protein